MIYEPREDSFFIAESVKKFAKGKVLDMGSGSGYLAEVALENTKDVFCCDIDEESAEFCKKKGLNCFRSNLFNNVKGKFDLIIFNPPYLPQDKGIKDRTIYGGKKGYEILERFLKKVKSYLSSDGKILILFSSLTGDVKKIVEREEFKFKELSRKKLDFEELYVWLIKQ